MHFCPLMKRYLLIIFSSFLKFLCPLPLFFETLVHQYSARDKSKDKKGTRDKSESFCPLSLFCPFICPLQNIDAPRVQRTKGTKGHKNSTKDEKIKVSIF